MNLTMSEKPHAPPPNVSARIVYFRDLKGWSGLRLAKETGIPQTTLAAWEKEPARIDELVDRLRAIAKALDVSVADLLNIPPPAPPQLRPGDFLVDLDAYEAERSGVRTPKGESWYAVIPKRLQLCTPHEYAAMDRQLPPRSRRERR